MKLPLNRLKAELRTTKQKPAWIDLYKPSERTYLAGFGLANALPSAFAPINL